MTGQWAGRIAGVFLVAALLGATSGCAKKCKVEFQLDDVINAPRADSDWSRQLDVDVIVLHPDDADNPDVPYQRMVNGSLRSDEWFGMRQDKSIGLDKDQIYAYCSERASDECTVLGPPFLSKKDRNTADDTYTAEFDLKDAGDAKTAIVIYGDFVAESGRAQSKPVVVNPIPGGWGDVLIQVEVGRTGLRWINRNGK